MKEENIIVFSGILFLLVAAILGYAQYNNILLGISSWIYSFALLLILAVIGILLLRIEHKKENLLMSTTALTGAIYIYIIFNVLCFTCDLIWGSLYAFICASSFAVLYMIHHEKKQEETRTAHEKTTVLYCLIALALFGAGIYLHRTKNIFMIGFVAETVLIALALIKIYYTQLYYEKNKDKMTLNSLRLTTFIKLSTATVLGIIGVAVYAITSGVV